MKDLNRLTAKKIEKLKEPGRYHDGGGLILQITESGARSWLLRYQRDKREHMAGLGPLSVAMSLYALATVYLYHFLSLGRSRFALVLAAILAVQLAIFAALHGSPRELIGVQIGVSAATLVACEAWHLLRHR